MTPEEILILKEMIREYTLIGEEKILSDAASARSMALDQSLQELADSYKDRLDEASTIEMRAQIIEELTAEAQLLEKQ